MGGRDVRMMTTDGGRRVVDFTASSAVNFLAGEPNRRCAYDEDGDDGEDGGWNGRIGKRRKGRT